MSGAPLICGDDLDAPLAWRAGRALSRRQYLADVQALAACLPGAGPMLNLSTDRYRFAVGLGAALLRGQNNLLPPNHTADTVARLLALFPTTYGLTDAAQADGRLPMVRHPQEAAGAAAIASRTEPPLIADSALAAQVLTSGSTGAPVPHAKHWGLLGRNTRAGAQRLAEQMGRSTLAGVTLVGTVPAQHMYGFESTVLVAMLGGAAFDTERPFYPADIAAALARAPRPRMLVTTPFHLKTLLDSGVALPAIDLTLCATAPLSPQLAARAESLLGAPLLEIYGCTEAGQVATRRTTAGAEWRTFDGLRLSGDGAATVVQGGHVQQPTLLADVLEVIDAHTFRLLGRSNDLINIAGKRSSLSHLNFHLNTIAGVHDGAFWLPPDDSAGGVVRPIAFVVAPGLPAGE
ncbi:MAG TPA: AMP-binding protein, partial [Burkholderiaceae bacterium]